MSDFFTEQLLAVVVVVDLHRGAGRAALGGIPARLTRCTVGKQDDKSLSGALARLTVFLRTQPLRPLYCCPVLSGRCRPVCGQSGQSSGQADRPGRPSTTARPLPAPPRPRPAQHTMYTVSWCIAQLHNIMQICITNDVNNISLLNVLTTTMSKPLY